MSYVLTLAVGIVIGVIAPGVAVWLFDYRHFSQSRTRLDQLREWEQRSGGRL